MPRSLIRFEAGAGPCWGVLDGQRIAPLAVDATTTADLLAHHWDTLWSSPGPGPTLAMGDVRLLAPVTPNQQFICQGVNYRSHVRESGQKEEDFPFNTIFTKASSCITAADAVVAVPPQVRLLDYEIELGLVLRRSIPAGTRVTPEDLPTWLAGVTIVNDLSARDVQLPQGQFYKGKSYRGFGPVGPTLVLLTPEDWRRWPELHMRLAVNGQSRQDAYCGDMLFQPPETLTELAALQDLHAGDLIATGTPAGCAARAPGKLVLFVLNHLMSPARKWRLFIGKNLNNPLYLRPGDRLSATIRTDDGAIDLGEQTNRIAA